MPNSSAAAGHHRQVLLVDAGVADRLVARERAVAQQVRQHDRLVVGPLRRIQRLGQLTGDGDAVPGTQIAQSRPPVQLQERVVGGGVDRPSRRKGEPEDFLVPRAEHMRHGARHQSQPVVERPHRHVTRAGGEQLPDAGLGARVGTQHAGRSRQAARFAKVREHRLLVGALLRGPVQLAERDDGDFEFLGEQLDGAGELRDLLLARFHSLARGHQLEVVDDDELEVLALLETTRLGPDLHHGQVGRVVDVERRLGHLTGAPGHAGPVVVAEPAGAACCSAAPRASAENSRIMISCLPISREKIAVD